MKKTTLKEIIYKNYLKTTLSSIFFIELVLLILYFYANNNILEKSKKLVLKDVRQSVNERVMFIKKDINNSFKDIETNLKYLQNEQQNFFKEINYIKNDSNVEFKYTPSGAYYKAIDNGGSSVLVKKTANLTDKLKTELNKTELLDNNLKTSVENNDLVVAAYYNSGQNYSRYYPFIKNVWSVIPNDSNIVDYTFYYSADLKHNPQKKVVWTDVYLDPAGLGWMISAIVPIYKGNTLEGVTGFDVTINKIIKNFLDFKIPYNGSTFLIDKDLNIIAMEKNIKEEFKIENFNEYKYSKNEKISHTIFRKRKDSLFFKNKELHSILENIIAGKNKKYEFKNGGEKYFIFSSSVDKLPWYTITLVKESNVLKGVENLKEEYIHLGILIIIFIIVFYFIFFIFLYKRANDFVLLINTPILKIINMTKILGSKKNEISLKDCGIIEIDKLSENFNNLAKELDIRTKELINAEASRAFHEKLSNTDALTKVYNRRFLEDFSKKYFEIIKREKTTLSILIVDIDDFKTINDNYGHEAGDEVLLKLVELMQNKIRENDFIVRLGGDEFLVLLPNSNIKGAKIVAEKLLKSICEAKNNYKRFTVSIGSAEFNLEDKDINCLIRRADEELYKAKKAGKNQLS
ncbi:diguanylate cyclase [Arcobacter nitrofigilis DSM 7299]|uniref:diguanylate cyclase n=1 Tax=Arcobacter nitrofigilis (strain ATCC 33309 / DSM 7299 / CCUG 15893 / LMG 7604 / NCTC 12251 / CI) TaxID=572480 RepID=D5V5A8_ARCNC|nr:diguanylate cyclase [Arcobacter nitrofigilis]ADG93043.1 diguanylate cyclase [Arcobacter nitrofigilis DSM 7299]